MCASDANLRPVIDNFQKQSEFRPRREVLAPNIIVHRGELFSAGSASVRGRGFVTARTRRLTRAVPASAASWSARAGHRGGLGGAAWERTAHTRGVGAESRMVVVVRLETPREPPKWALLEREMLESLSDACEEFFCKLACTRVHRLIMCDE